MHRRNFLVYENGLQLTNPRVLGKRGNPAPAARGKVCGFSRASRARLLRLLAQLRWSRLEQAQFITLTFHDVPDDWLARFRAFLQFLRRANVFYIWRLELQKRGAPHFHAIVFSNSFSEDVWRSAWHARANPTSDAHFRYGFHTREIDSYRMARAYLSKYVAKLDNPDHIRGSVLDGRRVWGSSRGLPVAPLHAFGLNDRGYFIARRIVRNLRRSRNRSRRKSRHFATAGVFAHVGVGVAVGIFRSVEAYLIPESLYQITPSQLLAADTLAAAFPRPPPAPVLARKSQFGPRYAASTPTLGLC